MEHHDLEDMFSRRAAAELELCEGLGPESGAVAKPRRIFLIGLKNTSIATARFPHIGIVGLNPPYHVWEYGIDGNGSFGLPRKAPGPKFMWLFAGGVDDVVHPGQETYAFGIVATAEQRPNGSLIFGSATDPAPIQLHCQIGWENGPARLAKIAISTSRILARFRGQS